MLPAIQKFFQDKHGKIVIWQMPNILLWSWLLFMLLAQLSDPGQVKAGLQFISTASLFSWAYLELTKGASYFRRLLGLVVLASLVVSHFRV